jgi:hypothetical protein
MDEDHFDIDATPEAVEYLSKIATKMASLFSIGRAEAVGRINKLWGTGKQLRTEMQLSLFFRENVEYWARLIYYRDNTKWWRDGEELIPRNYP